MILTGFAFMSLITNGQNVGVGTTTPASSAQLEVSSTSKGFLPPRMTDAQKAAIASPVAGLIIWCTNCGPSGELQVYNGTKWTNMVGGTASNNIVIGANYGGGKVAYIYQAGDAGYVAGEIHGIIAAVSDQTIDNLGVTWGCAGVAVSGADSTGLGTGDSNTADIIAQGCTETVTAAKLCNDYTAGGYTDWVLPSKDELNKLYLQRTAIGNFSAGNAPYWSSSETSTFSAWYQTFGQGTQATNVKEFTYLVRAIRYF